MILLSSFFLKLIYFCPRCEDYAISLLEQCEDLREVETFLQTRNCGTKDSNYILAILDSRMKFVAHERFQYVMLKKFGKFSLSIVRYLVISSSKSFLKVYICIFMQRNSGVESFEFRESSYSATGQVTVNVTMISGCRWTCPLSSLPCHGCIF